jgi:NTP pyrophosphatase (non-canonical NTP hydrolase)
MTFDDYQKQAMTTALDLGGSFNDLTYRSLGLTSEAGEVADKIKKIIRDKGGEMTAEDKKAIASELGDVLWYVQALATYLDVSLNQIAEDNLTKLLDRKSRGAIGGSGDTR